MKRQIAAVVAAVMLFSLLSPAAYAEESPAQTTAVETVQSETTGESPAAEEMPAPDADAVPDTSEGALATGNDTPAFYAAEGSIVASGTCGDNLTWTLDDAGTLTISGTGEMTSHGWSNYKNSIKTLVVEEGATSICDEAFSNGCTSLESITLPDSLETIGDYAFHCCSALKDVILPNTLEAIGKGAFNYCSSLTTIEIPVGVTLIKDNPFTACSSLTAIQVDEDNSKFCSVDGVLFTRDKKQLCAFPLGKKNTSYVVPAGVTRIGISAFESCSTLKSVTFPDSLETIDDRAFGWCDALTTIDIPGKVTSIGEFAFCACSALESITLSDSLKSIDHSTFDRCTSLTAIDIPDKVTSIGSFAFSNCSALESVTFPDSLESIDSGAFESCTSLTSIDIPDSVSNIYNAAFSDCSALKSITISDSLETIERDVFWGCTSLTSISIPDKVTSIGIDAFGKCISLAYVNIPKSVTFIDQSAFIYCHALSDVYYSGTEAGRNEITILSYNDQLLNATWHYTGSGPQEPVSASRLYYVSRWDETAQKITLDEGLAYSVTESTVYADGATPETLVGKYALVETDTENIWQITSIQPVVSQIGTLSAIDESSLTIGETVYPRPSDSALLWDGYKGREVLYHTLNGKVLSLVPLEENHGVLDDWDPDTGHAEIDGKTYPTNPLTDLSFVDEVSRYLDHQIVYFTAGGTSYMPLIRVDGFYYPTDPTHFNAATYHAQWLSSDRDTADALEEDTPSRIFQDQMSDSGELALSAWQAFSAVFDAMDDPTSLYNLSVKERDVYCALILDALEASTSVDFIGGEVEDGIKLSKTLVSNVCAVIKADWKIDLYNNEEFSAFVTNHPDILQECVDDVFKEKQSDLAQLNKSFKYFSTGLKVVSTIEDFCEYCAACYALVDTSDAMIEVLQRAYDLCYSVDGATSEKTLAFKKCLDMITDGSEELYTRMAAEYIHLSGKFGAEYLIKEELWKTVTNKIKTACPEVAILQAGYKAGETISNLLFSTDDTSEQYLKMSYITSIESTIDRIYWDLERDFGADQIPSSERATAYLAGMQLSFSLRDVDCETAGKYIDVVDDSAFSKIAQFFGAEDHTALKKSLERRKNYYADSYFHAETGWIDGLKTDYPETGLYEVFDQILRGGNDIKAVKEFLVACPVNVYVYDSSGNVVASVVDGRVSCTSEDIMIGVLGEQKIIRFHDNTGYRLEYVGTDSGDMDITITEFGGDENVVRTVNYNDVALTDGTEYHMNVPEENKQAYALINSASSAAVDHEYDSMDNNASHAVKINSGYFQHNGTLGTEITASAGETIELNAYVPEDGKFLRWEATSAAAKIEDESSMITTMIMPDEDVTVTAVVQTPEPSPAPEPTEEPIPSTEPTEEPAPSTKPTEEPAPSTKPTEEPAPSTKPTEKPTPSTKPTETPKPSVKPEIKTTPIYRLYNPYTLEHLLTANQTEMENLVAVGWSLDGIAWNAPADGTPVYRLYNPYDDFHFYTMSMDEVDSLTPLGWTLDGVVCSSAPEDGKPIFRLFNPYEQTCYHMYTASTQERDYLASLGWVPEGVAWYALAG